MFILSIFFNIPNIIIDGKDRNAICTDIVKIQLMFILVSKVLKYVPLVEQLSVKTGKYKISFVSSIRRFVFSFHTFTSNLPLFL